MKPLTCISQTTGRTLWTYRNAYPSNSHDSPLPEPGEIQHTLNVEGEVSVPNFGKVFLLNGNKGVRYLFSGDGIFLGTLFADQRLAEPLSISNVREGMDLTLAGCGTLVNELLDCADRLAADGIALEPFLETGNTDVITRLVRENRGVSFLPEFVVREDLESGRLTELSVDCPQIELFSQLVYHRNKLVTPQMELFIRLLEERISKKPLGSGVDKTAFPAYPV